MTEWRLLPVHEVQSCFCVLTLAVCCTYCEKPRIQGGVVVSSLLLLSTGLWFNKLILLTCLLGWGRQFLLQTLNKLVVRYLTPNAPGQPPISLTSDVSNDRSGRPIDWSSDKIDEYSNHRSTSSSTLLLLWWNSYRMPVEQFLQHCCSFWSFKQR